MLEFDRVRKHYSGPGGVVRAVDGVNLSVAESEFVAVFGPSGSGKTTLLMLAAGLLRADGGALRFRGSDLATMSKADSLAHRRNELGFIFQNFNLLPGLTAEENVGLPLLLRGTHHREASNAAAAWLDRVGLGERALHRPPQLSGGEQQRVAIARALVGKPKLILADEPTGNLDTHRGEEVLSLLSDLARDGGVAVMLATHDARAVGYADHAHTLQDGRLEDHDHSRESAPPAPVRSIVPRR